MATNFAPYFGIGDGKVVTPIGNGLDRANALVLLPDGRILLGGESQLSNRDFAAVRYNTDGTLDTTFSGDGKLTTAYGSGTDQAFDAAVLANGELLLAGTSFQGSTLDFAIARYSTDGIFEARITTDFGGGADVLFGVLVQPDGRILAGGQTQLAGNMNFALARYLTDGTLDTAFDTDGRVVTDWGGTDTLWRISLQPDGRILAAGSTTIGGTADFAIARYDVNGNLDTTFSGDGLLTLSIGSGFDEIRDVAALPDGSILAAGFAQSGTQFDFALARFDAAGILDTTFGVNGIVVTDFGTFSDVAYEMKVMSDGRIVVAGESFNGTDRDFAVARYLADGSLDLSFDGDGRVIVPIGSGDDLAFGVAVEPGGRIVLGGPTLGTTEDFAMARLNADGSLDRSFDPVNRLDGIAAYTENGPAVVMDSDVSVFDPELAAQGHYAGATLTLERSGGANAQDVFSHSGLLAPLVPAGALVYDGVTVGTVTTNAGGTLALTFDANATQARVDGVLRALAYSSPDNAPPAFVQIAWTFSDGNTSGAQGDGGALAVSGTSTISITAVNDAPVNVVPGALSVNEDSTLVVNGISVSDAEASTLDVRLTASHGLMTLAGTAGLTFSAGDGVADSFVQFRGAQAAVNAALAGLVYRPEPDYAGPDAIQLRTIDLGATGTGGTLVDTDTIAISVNAVNDAPRLTLGTGKVITGAAGADSAEDIALQSDGRIVVAALGPGGPLLRYDALGTLDSSFSADGIATTTDVFALAGVALLPDGRVVAGATRQDSASGDYELVVLRYDGSGNLDSTFTGDGVAAAVLDTFDARATAFALQADGRMVVAGETSNPANGERELTIARFNGDGSLDSGLGGDGTVTLATLAGSMAVQADGRILLAEVGSGDFVLLRLNADGTPDLTFDGDGRVSTNFSSFDDVRGLALQPDGKIVAVGYTGFFPASRIALARYNADGSLDTTFDGDGKVTTDLGTSAEGASVAIQADGRIVVAGFARVGDADDFALARYNADGSLDTTFSGDGVLTTPFGTGIDRAHTVAVYDDASIVAAGTALFPSGPAVALARFDADGTPDSAFGAPAYQRGAAPVVLDDLVQVFDVELAAGGDYAGASVVLQRASGPNAEDIFSNSGNLEPLTGGSALRYSGVEVGTVVANGAGRLELTFGAGATQAMVNSVLQAIAYSNASATPPDVVTIRWTFSDGNGAAQGSGGAGGAIGDTSVFIASGPVTYLWSALSDGAVIPGFDPARDVLRFDDASIAAGEVDVTAGSAIFRHGGKTVTLGLDLTSVTGIDVVFDDGSVLRVGDDALGSVADGAANTLTGTAQDDHLIGAGGADMLDGGSGFDRAGYGTATGVVAHLTRPAANTGEAAGDGYVSIEGLIGSRFADVLVGDGAQNDLRGAEGNDYLEGRGGDDTLGGGDGTDHLEGDGGADHLDGGAGFDYARYLYAAGHVHVDLLGVVSPEGDALGDTFTSIEGVVGSRFDDRIFGTDAANDLVGAQGADQIHGRGGDDGLQGGDDDDVLDGGAGADRLDGGNGEDMASYELAPDGVTASLADAYVNIGEASGDRYVSIERLLGSSHSDTLVGNERANVLSGGAGADFIDGGGDADLLVGGDGNDRLRGGAGGDALDGGSGFDYAFYASAALGVSVSLADAGDNGGEAAGDHYTSVDGVVGSLFDDVLRGDEESNDLAALDGADEIFGRGGSDVLRGGNGDDTLDGGAGIDRLFGGPGNDTFVLHAGQSHADIVVDFAGGGPDVGDRIEFHGYGLAADGATFTPTPDPTRWTINAADGAVRETLVIFNAALIDPGDYTFI